MAEPAGEPCGRGRQHRPSPQASPWPSPYLNWWKIYYARAQAERRRDIEEVATRIASRAALVDWSKGGEEEIFRALYESLLDPEDRRKLGEYYT
ncbi:MAG: hypothetical protein ABDH61_02980, partial [Acidilobaceae archaeon]